MKQYGAFLRKRYFSMIDYTIYDHLRSQGVQVSAGISKVLVIPGRP